jgi:hypothetical protein
MFQTRYTFVCSCNVEPKLQAQWTAVGCSAVPRGTGTYRVLCEFSLGEKISLDVHPNNGFFRESVGGLVMETTHSEKQIRKNGEGECWWSRIASPYPDANHVAPPAANDEKEYRTRSLSRCNRRLLHAFTATAQPPLKRKQPQTTGGSTQLRPSFFQRLICW